MSGLRAIPVLDLMGGRVVRGVAGKRESYQPLVSKLAAGPEPLRIAEAIRDQLGLTEFYVADLDGIVQGVPDRKTIRALADAGFALMVDAGLLQAEQASPIFDAGAARVIAGLETLVGPDELARLCGRYSAERVIFSLDLRGGRSLADGAFWPSDPLGIAYVAVEAGVTQLIVLDIAQVGIGEGITTLPLCRAIADAFPHLRLITGGGVRGVDDLRVVAAAGLDGVLVASALHDDRITRGDLDSMASAQLPM